MATIKEKLEEKALFEDYLAQGIDSTGTMHTVIQLDGAFYLLSESMNSVTHRILDMANVMCTVGMVHEMDQV